MTRRSSSTAARTACTCARRASGSPTRGRTLSTDGLRAGRQGAGLRAGGRARHGDHARPRRVRAAGADRLGHGVPVAGRRCVARGCRGRPALHARRHPGRRRLGAERAGAQLGCRRARARDGRAGRTGRGSGRGAARDRSPLRRQRGPARGVRRAGLRRRGAGARCAPSPAASRRRRSARSATDPPGMVLVDTGFGGQRVLDLLAGDPLPRIC